MAQPTAQDRGVSVQMACEASFGIRQTCYGYVAKAQAENEEIANWLLRLTDNHRNWGFGWTHERVYRIYRELELNLRIKPQQNT